MYKRVFIYNYGMYRWHDYRYVETLVDWLFLWCLSMQSLFNYGCICVTGILLYHYILLVRSFLYDTERPSVKQSIKQQVCSNFQMSCTLRRATPPGWNCQWQQIKSLLIYVFNESPFKMISRIRSSFQMRCTLRQADPPTWNCQWQQIKSSLMYVCNESPFETVIFITALHCVKLYILSFGVELLER